MRRVIDVDEETHARQDRSAGHPRSSRFQGNVEFQPVTSNLSALLPSYFVMPNGVWVLPYWGVPQSGETTTNNSTLVHIPCVDVDAEIEHLHVPKKPRPEVKRPEGIGEEVVCQNTMREECCVCLSRMKRKQRLTYLPCLHRFHSKCVQPWLRRCSECPVCRFVV